MSRSIHINMSLMDHTALTSLPGRSAFPQLSNKILAIFLVLFFSLSLLLARDYANIDTTPAQAKKLSIWMKPADGLNSTSRAVSRFALGDTPNNGRVSDKAEPISNTTKIILLWNLLAADFSCLLVKKQFCPNITCLLTTNKSDFSRADAVIMRGVFLGLIRDELPKRAHQNQLFVFHIYESPLTANQANWLDNLDGLFNLTFTYMRSDDTDITSTLSSLVKLETPGNTSLPTLETVQRRTRMAAWAVSNCHSKSIRWEYAQELSKYVQVDIFGNCGNLSCPRNNTTCFDQISEKYLFYLSFENSWCQDYITEKVYRPLTHFHSIPIILGGANYSHDIPPHSYLHVKDFDSPKHLAEYMFYLRDNITAYMEYFEWKKYYTFKHVNDGICQLCDILTKKTHEKKAIKPKEYWDPDKLCLKGDSEMKAAHLSYLIESPANVSKLDQ